jgi:hypothetical protein
MPLAHAASPTGSRPAPQACRNKVETKKQRFLEDTTPVRLGRLAAHLSSVRLYAIFQGNRDTVESLLEETWRFAEWAASDAGPGLRNELNALQLTLDSWHAVISKTWSNQIRRMGMAREAGLWSRKIIEMSGLLKRQQ